MAGDELRRSGLAGRADQRPWVERHHFVLRSPPGLAAVVGGYLAIRALLTE